MGVATAIRRPIERAVRFAVVSDPGQLRLRSAAATTITLVLALAVLYSVTRALGQPITVAMLGTVVAMFTSFVVKDRTTRGKLVTNALIPLPAIAAVSLSAVLAQHGKIADVGFIAVLFTAVWVRRFGPRGFALGMASFISYFFALFLRAAPSQIPVLALSIVVGVSVAFAVRLAFLREPAGAELRRLTNALRASCVSVLEITAPDRAGDSDDIRRGLERLANTALMIEDWLDRNEASLHLSVTSDDLSRRVFDAQQATEQLVFALDRLDRDWSTTLGRAMLAVAATLHNSPSDQQLRAARKMVAAGTADPVDQTGVALHYAMRTVAAHTALHRVTLHAVQEPSPAKTVEAEDDSDDPSTEDGSWISRLKPSTRSAIQVAIATSIATVLGEFVSPDRWYWAVLSAFVVFTGTTTRGEILTRAGHRVVGTVAGVFAGVLLSALVGQRPALQLLLIVVCVFFAFYLVTIANSLLVFFVTILLAMLYGLLGTFSIAVLEVRIEETLVGATVGIGAAFFILPTRTRDTLVQKVDDYLDKLDAVIVASVDSVVTPGSGVDLVPLARELDAALQDTITAAKPFGFGPTTRARRGTARLVRVLESCDRAARSLAKAGISAAAADADTAPRVDTVESLRTGTDLVRSSLSSLRNVVRGDADEYDDELDKSDPAGAFTFSGRSPESGATRAAVRALNRLDHAAALTRVPV
ncbi:FUSC family protein [Actinomycetes bacterium M1A6_2h]